MFDTFSQKQDRVEVVQGVQAKSKKKLHIQVFSPVRILDTTSKLTFQKALLYFEGKERERGHLCET